MNRLWKNFRTNLMYWRFRYITRNRLRLRNWWMAQRRRPRGLPAGASFRPRASASQIRYSVGSRRRTWAALLTMIVLLTGLSALADRVLIAPGIVYAIGSLIVIACAYWALKNA